MDEMYKIINTVKYMNARQIVFRSRYEFMKKLRKRIKQKSIKGHLSTMKYICLDEAEIQFYRKNYEVELDKIDEILKNKFTFLNNMEYRFSDKIEWNADPYQYRLWMFNLNYFDYLESLMEAHIYSRNIKYLNKGMELIKEWIRDNSSKYDKDLWDPFVVAKRLCNWSVFISYSLKNININTSDIDSINGMILTQAEFLSRNIEYYLDANHIIMDAKGLIFSGVYLSDMKYIEKGLEILLKEYQRQILKDGGHYEKSTSYHVEVLQHYLEVYLLLTKNDYSIDLNIIKKICYKMFNYLSNITMPNKEIPLVNDSSLDYPIYSNDILQCGAIIFNNEVYKSNCTDKLSSYSFRLFGIMGLDIYNMIKLKDKYIQNIQLEDSGYYIIKDKLQNNKELYLLFDCGDNGPEYNLGHTHADNLNVILTIGNDKVLVDSGTYTYKNDEYRNLFRSTKMHNTIVIDNRSSSEIWSAFRVAKRAKTKRIDYIEGDNSTIICAEHNGYAKVIQKDKLFHKRWIVYLKNIGIIIIDKIYGKFIGSHKININFISGLENLYSISDKELLMVSDSTKLKVQTSYSNKIEKKVRSERFSEKINCTGWIGEEIIDKDSYFITTLSFKENIKVNLENGIASIFSNEEVIKRIKV